MKELKDLKKEIILTIKGNSYTVKFPDTGTLIDLERHKARTPMPSLSNTSAAWAYNLDLAIKTFGVLIPKLEEDLNVKDFYKLELMESRELVKVYLEDFKPWFEEWMELVADVFGSDENDSKDA